jgi:hypothetical protein
MAGPVPAIFFCNGIAPASQNFHAKAQSKRGVPTFPISLGMIKLLASINDRLRVLLEALDRMDGVMRATRGINVQTYNSGPRFEAYVECNLADGSTLAWTLDICENDTGWTVERHVYRSSDSHEFDYGMRALIEFADYHAGSESDLISRMPALLDDFCSSPETVLAASAIERQKDQSK